jgi:hypothetical protein
VDKKISLDMRRTDDCNAVRGESWKRGEKDVRNDDSMPLEKEDDSNKATFDSDEVMMIRQPIEMTR